MNGALKVLICKGGSGSDGHDPIERLRFRGDVARGLEADFAAEAASSEFHDIRERSNALSASYGREAEWCEKLVADLEHVALNIARAVETLAYKLSGDEWLRVKALIDGICSEEGCSEPVAAEDEWTPERHGLAFELCAEHYEVVLEDDAANSFVAAQKERVGA